MKIINLLIFVQFNAFKCIDQTELATLQQFYKDTNGDQWYENSNWDLILNTSNASDANICPDNVPYGLGCSSNQHIVTLRFTSNNLNGVITPLIDGLQHLSFLHLKGNYLYQTIPQTIFNIPYIKEFVVLYDLGNLTFEMSNQLCNLQYLITFGVESIGNINGSIPNCIGNLTQLESFHILNQKNNNQFDLGGTIPPSLFKINALQSIS